MNDLVEYCDLLAQVSTLIIAAVHRGDDPSPYIDRALAVPVPALPERVDPCRALVAVLAAQVDPDTDIHDRLTWTRAYHPDVVAACERRTQ
jgi:hypothetical protein